MKFSKILCFILLTLLLFSCSSDIDKHQLNENNILQVGKDSLSITVSEEFLYLDASESVATSSVPFTQVKAFIADDDYLKQEFVQGEPFIFLEVPKHKDYISGKIIYENATEENMNIRSLFLQGNYISEIKLSDSEFWKTAIEYEVPAYSSVTINIDIKWDDQGMQELTFFPLDLSSDPNRYDGGSLSTYRFFVQSKDITLTNDLIEKQSFDVNVEELPEDVDLFPIPLWLDDEGIEIQHDLLNEQLITKQPIKSIQLAATPYNTNIDLVMIDEYGNTKIIAENVSIKEKESTIFNIEQKDLVELKSKDSRQFLLVFNNREEEILADLKVLNLYKKPFFTSYQGVIEFYKYKNE
ncbi:hypothetical protein [Halalkalibacter alkalisediminis]|uniref:Lipoprotein n=1 Tax=Halalkalibacter alkalisediminis TaxID=935616 RepID=A0ABV6NNW6_9BACI|nr:hypothetical protein [Halalkalibacter alkalisediminis]